MVTGPDSCPMHFHKTDSLTLDSRRTQTPPDPTTGATIASIAFLATRDATIRTLLQLSLSHEQRTHIVERDGYCEIEVLAAENVYIYVIFETEIGNEKRVDVSLRLAA
jgi:hypothetical protein